MMKKRKMSVGEPAVGKTNALSSIVRIMMSQVLTLIMMKKMTTMVKNIKGTCNRQGQCLELHR